MTEPLDLVRANEPLSQHCTWRVGGPADHFAEPANSEQLIDLLHLAHKNQWRLVVIGLGSNLLFSDEGLRGLVIKIGPAISHFEISGTRVTSDAGVWIPRLARALVSSGLSGFEHMIGVPASLGGLIAMNGGSHGQSVGDVVRRVRVVSRRGQARWMDDDECDFSYRHSAFHSLDDIIVGAELEFTPGDIHQTRAIALADLRDRRRKFPLKQPSCGSVFQSVGEMYDRFGPPGKVIEDTGLKGFRIGDAQVSHQHANFIVNQGNATARDILAVIDHVRTTVHERTGRWMPCEARRVSPDGSIAPAHERLRGL